MRPTSCQIAATVAVVILGGCWPGLEAWAADVAGRRESPYERIVRLRREAVARETQATGQATAGVVGPVVDRVELKLVRPRLGSPTGFLGLQRQDTTLVRPPALRETPPDAPREPVYFVVRVGDRDLPGITYRSMHPPGHVLLWLDTDGDGLLSDERPYAGARLAHLTLYAT